MCAAGFAAAMVAPAAAGGPHRAITVPIIGRTGPTIIIDHTVTTGSLRKDDMMLTAPEMNPDFSVWPRGHLVW